MFSKEVDLVDNFLNNIAKEFEFKNYEIICEYPYNAGRADIVLASVNQRKLKRRIKNGLSNPLRNKMQIQILFHLSKRKRIRKDKLKEIFNSQSLKSNIRFLLDNGYIKEGKKTYCITKGYNIHVDNVVSIEAKIKNFSRAIEQALLTSSFANQRYILMDSDHLPNISTYIDILEKNGLGLLVVNKDFPQILKKSQTIDPYSEIAHFYLNEYHFKMRNSNYECS